MHDDPTLDPTAVFGPTQQCFGCGPNNASGMQLKFERDGEEIITHLHAGEGWEGPPGVLHGGLQATLADEVGAWALIGLRGRFGFTTTMNLRYYRPARIADPIEGRARITDESEKMAVVQVTLRQDGKRILSGKISYAKVTAALAEKMMGRALPEEWRHLAG